MSYSTDSIDRILRHLGDRCPARVREAITVARSAPEQHRARLLAAVGEVVPALAPFAPSIDGPIAPAYPAAPRDAQARIALGERPSQILRGLTDREAHECLRDGADPIDYLLFGLAGLPARTALQVNHTTVARWLAECWRDPARRAALELEREMPGPGGAIIRGRLIDRIDEIRATDLRKGMSRGVQDVYRRAAERLWAQWAARNQSDESELAAAPKWWRPLPYARLLLTRAALIREGRELSHCVGTYAPAVARGDSLIVSICIRDREGAVHRSTAEVSRCGSVIRQHKSHSNREPTELCRRALMRAARLAQLEKEEGTR